MVKLMVILLAFFLFLTLFSVTMYVFTRKQKSRKKVIFTGGKYLERIRNLSITTKVSEYLKGGGNPISAELLVIIHIIAILIILFQLLGGQGKNISLTAILILFIDALIMRSVRKYKSKIISELCNIQDIFYFQSKINTPQDVILAYAVRQCKEPLKTPLENLLARYKYMGGKKDIKDIFDEFRKTSDVMELQSFSFILEQRERNGFSEQNHEAQSMMLKRSKRLQKRELRHTKRLKLIIASVMLFVCYTGFISIPILKQLYSKLTYILK